MFHFSVFSPKHVGLGSKRKPKICKQEQSMSIEINLNNECDVKLHSKTSYCCNLNIQVHAYFWKQKYVGN
jgi:preprotein translocase subunit SecB